MYKTKIKTITLCLLLLCAWGMVGCGFKPPKEFHTVEKAAPTEFEISHENESYDAGSDETLDETPDVVNGRIHLTLGLASIPTLPLSQLLTKTRDTIEALFEPVSPETEEEKKSLEAAAADGWIKYSTHLQIWYMDGVAMKMKQNVPANLSCVKAAQWLGFEDAKTPASEDDAKCEWLPNDAEHSLSDGYHGSIAKDTMLFLAIVTPAK